MVADGRFAPEPPIEPSGRVEALLERVARGGGLGFPVSAGRASVNNCPRERRTRVYRSVLVARSVVVFWSF